MHGGAVTLAKLFLEESLGPDLILATDMLDLATFMALTRRRTAGIKTAIYFHENQITYPWSQRDPDPAGKRDVHYGFINLTSALAADAVVFNSEYHRSAFLSDLGPFLHAFPDHNEEAAVETIAAKSYVLHLGIDLRRFDSHRIERGLDQKPLILWNHRWEYDKNPDDFFGVLLALAGEGTAFEVAVLGEGFAETPSVFADAASKLGERIIQSGFVRDFPGYASWLWRADIIPVTSNHDFFGASVVQAIYCNTYPILPDRLAYPEHLVLRASAARGKSVPDMEPAGPGQGASSDRSLDRGVADTPGPDVSNGPPLAAERRSDYMYEDFDGLVAMLRRRIHDIHQTRQVETQHLVRRYDWEAMAPKYDRFFEAVVEQ